MSYQNEKFQALKEWNIYKDSESFKKYIIKSDLSEASQKDLIAAYGELKRLENTDNQTLYDASVLDRALEIKSRYENRASPTQSRYNPQMKKTIQENANKEFESLEFRGDTMEYFKIWIVNIFLTIVTLGIYSAWAKVRTNRYFYANTFYQNSSFEYTANPIDIFKGRLIVTGLYGIFIFSAQVMTNPIVAGGMMLAFLLIIPWIINRAIKFKLKNIKHRNINFRYDEDASSFYSFFLLHTILNVITIGLAYPYSLNKFKALLIDNSKFGGSEFSYSGTTGDMYMQYLKILGLYFGVIVIVAIVVGASTYIGQNLSLSTNNTFLFAILPIVTYFATISIGFAIKGFYDAYISNFVWGETALEDNSFESTLNPMKLSWIYVSNIFAIIFSLGFLAPWAKIRVTNYKCENFAIASSNMSSFIATQQEKQNSLGEEAGDFFDIDVGI